MGIRFYRDSQLPLFEIKSCDSGVHATRKHVHEEFSLGIITKGSSIITVAEKDYPVDTGTVILIAPGFVHQCRPVNLKNWGFMMLYLKADWVRSLTGGDDSENSVCVKKLSPEEHRLAAQWCADLRDHRSGMEKETCLISLLDLALNLEDVYRVNSHPGSSDIQAIGRVRDFIHEHFLEKINLDDLTQVSGISKYHLIRLFKAVYRTPPHAYQTMLRINYAKSELAKSGADITTIAQNAGFYDQSHFVKIFKMYYGTTPVNYRLGE